MSDWEEITKERTRDKAWVATARNEYTSLLSRHDVWPFRYFIKRGDQAAQVSVQVDLDNRYFHIDAKMPGESKWYPLVCREEQFPTPDLPQNDEPHNFFGYATTTSAELRKWRREYISKR